jgi:hypothetical protein
LILNTHPHPHIRRPGQAARKAACAIRSLGQDLERVPWRLRHNPKCSFDQVEWHFIMEEVTHGVHEDSARIAPTARQVEQALVNGDLKTVAVSLDAHCLQPV